MAKILFYSPVNNLVLFERMGFYATDIQLLKDLGHSVVTTNSLRSVCGEHYDILFVYFYTWSSLAVVIGRLRKKMTFMTGGADQLDPSYNKSLASLLLYRCLFCLGYYFSSTVFAVSLIDFQNMSRLVGKNKLLLVPHVVDTARYLPGSNRMPLNLLTIGWMGTEENVRRKGMDVAIRILAHLQARSWFGKLVIVGAFGPGTEALRQLAIDMKVSDKVEFKFGISENEKISLLQTCSYYLQLSEFEGFGLAALEALSCGACVIHTGRGGLAYFMGDYGLLQTWPPKPQIIAHEIIAHSLSADMAQNEAQNRHLYVVMNFSLTRRREALASQIYI